jgi:hypothetical protein
MFGTLDFFFFKARARCGVEGMGFFYFMPGIFDATKVTQFGVVQSKTSLTPTISNEDLVSYTSDFQLSFEVITLCTLLQIYL